MYTKDKSNRITLRLNDEQFHFVKSSADVVGVSPSEFLRMVVNVCMASSTMAGNAVEHIDEKEIDKMTAQIKEVTRRENEAACNDHQL